MALPLLKTKLFVPPARPELVLRPRLVAQLNSGLHRKLSLVAAPAGFGKTTLLSEWARQCERPIAWLSLEADDSSPVRFLTYLMAALESLDLNLSSDIQFPPQPTQNISLKPQLTQLINDIIQYEQPLVLVLDDYHLIHNDSIQAGLTFLLEHQPPNLHLLLAGRVDPPLPLARLRTRNQLTEIRAADLRFTPQEAAAFFNEAMGLRLSEDDIHRLEARTEGWIAGLQLAALSMQNRRDAHDFITAFNGSHRHVIDYLAEEVIARQLPEWQDFLRRTSVLTRFCAPLCDAVTGRTDSEAILSQLEQANLFLIPLDQERRWYRYHHLFGDFLNTRLQQRSPELVPELHRRAGAWFEASFNEQTAAGRRDEQLLETAIEHSLAAEDFDHAAGLIAYMAEHILLRGEMSTFLAWVDRLPAEVLDRQPHLAVYAAGLGLLYGRSLDTVEDQLAELGRNPDTLAQLSAEIRVFRALIAAYQGDMRQSAGLAQQALASLPSEARFLRSFVAAFLGLAYLFNGEMTAARQSFTDGVRIGRQVGNLLAMTLSTCHLAELAYYSGDLREAERLFEDALAITEEPGKARRPVGGMALVGLGLICYERFQLTESTRLLDEGLSILERWSEVGGLQGYITLGRVRQQQEDHAGAMAAIEMAERLARQFDAMQLDDALVDNYKIEILLAEGRLAEAKQRAAQHFDSPAAAQKALSAAVAAETLPMYLAFEFFILARVYLAEGQLITGTAMLDEISRFSLARGWNIIAMNALIFAADARYRQQYVPRATEDLKQALRIGEPGGFVTSFVTAGSGVQALLQHLQRHEAYFKPAYVQQLLEAWPESSKLSAASPPPPPLPDQSALIEPLSERELEVLQLIEAGYANREIATRLVVALSTVKTHINNIYRKLEVSSRTRALARARELNLL